MEAIAGVNRGGVPGCSFLHRASLPAMPCKRNLLLFGRNYHIISQSDGLQTLRQSLFSSNSFQDQSHLQFYLNDRKSGRKEKPANSVLRKAAARLDEAVNFGAWNDAERNFDNKAGKRAKKMEIRMQKKLKKVARAAAGVSSSSTSSSSSSESEAWATTERRMKTMRTDMEKLRREWECISQSPLMQSIPTLSPNFVLEQPQAQQRLESPLESSCAAREAEVASSAVISEVLNSVMALRNSSSADVSVSYSGLPLSMAGVTIPRQSSAVAAGVEVCMGGKCKKAGSQAVLSAFQANGVAASACNKCMKKCKFAVNVLIDQDGDDVPQMYSGIGVEHVDALSQKHFGAGAASRAQDLFSLSLGAVHG